MNSIAHISTLNRLVSIKEEDDKPLNDSKGIDGTLDRLTTQRFCFSCIFMDLGVKLSLEQMEQMLSILTPQQIIDINSLLDQDEYQGRGSSWY